MKNKKYLLTFIYILSFSMVIFSQAAALVLTHFDITDEELMKETQEQVTEQMQKELSRQNLEYWDDSYVASAIRNRELTSFDLMKQNVAIRLGKEAEVPVVITVQAYEKENFLEITISAWDVTGEQKIAEDRKVSRSSVTRFIMINSSISYVTDQLTGEYGIPSITEDPMVRKITFISNQEGLEVYMPDGEFL